MKALVLVILFMIHIFLYSCSTTVSEGSEPNIGKSLKVEIISPREGGRVQGKITIQANVDRPEEVNFLDFYIQEPGVKDRYGWIEYSPPYFWGGGKQRLDTTLFEDGQASAVVFCHPRDRHLPITQHRVHFIIDNGKPRIKILSPKDDTIISGNTIIRVEANDLKGMHREPAIVAVYIYMDGSLLQVLKKAPFQTMLNTCLLSPGLHSIQAVAEDSEGLTSRDSIVVAVDLKGSAIRSKK